MYTVYNCTFIYKQINIQISDMLYVQPFKKKKKSILKELSGNSMIYTKSFHVQ